MPGGRGLDINQLKELARDAAALALKQLRAEVEAIEQTFPELARPEGREAMRQSLKNARKRGGEMTTAARKAVSARMKKYSAERRKATSKEK
jgi:hypothetical protein